MDYTASPTRPDSMPPGRFGAVPICPQHPAISVGGTLQRSARPTGASAFRRTRKHRAGRLELSATSERLRHRGLRRTNARADLLSHDHTPNIARPLQIEDNDRQVVVLA